MPDESVAPPAPTPPAAPAPGIPGPGAGPVPNNYPKPRPAGEPEAVLKIRELIEAQLEKMVEGYWEQEGSYLLGYESARVWVVPAWLESGATVIRVFAITNMGVEINELLTSYLVTKNLDFVVGAFALDAEAGAVWFNHNLLGEFAVAEELGATIVMVAETADKFDDEIKAQFGGRLYSETPDQAIPPPNTPGYI
jgi:hypothetical protein